MPLNIKVDDIAVYAGAVLPVTETLDDAIAALPGLVGAWDAADWAAGDWVARIGGGRIALTNAAAGARDGDTILSFGATSLGAVRNAASAAVVPGELAFAARSYFSSVTANFQKIFDLGTPEFFMRPTQPTPSWQYKDATPTSTSVALAGGAVARWRTFALTKAGTASPQIEADGAAPVTIGPAGGALGATTLAIGDASGANGAVHEISRLIITTSGALTDAQRAAIRQWLAM